MADPTPVNAYNPLRYVDNVELFPAPSKYQQIVSDISKADSGRTEDGKMWKEKVGQLTKIELEWSYLTTSQVTAILSAFDPEYFDVTVLDAKSGEYRTAEFYVGDRTMPLYNSRIGVWENLSLNIIERTPT